MFLIHNEGHKIFFIIHLNFIKKQISVILNFPNKFFSFAFKSFISLFFVQSKIFLILISLNELYKSFHKSSHLLRNFSFTYFKYFVYKLNSFHSASFYNQCLLISSIMFFASFDFKNHQVAYPSFSQ